MNFLNDTEFEPLFHLTLCTPIDMPVDKNRKMLFPVQSIDIPAIISRMAMNSGEKAQQSFLVFINEWVRLMERNNSLQRLIDLNAPELVIENSKAMIGNLLYAMQFGDKDITVSLSQYGYHIAFGWAKWRLNEFRKAEMERKRYNDALDKAYDDAKNNGFAELEIGDEHFEEKLNDIVSRYMDDNEKA